MVHSCHWGSSSPAWLKNVGRDRPPIVISQSVDAHRISFCVTNSPVPQPGSGPADALTLAYIGIDGC